MIGIIIPAIMIYAAASLSKYYPGDLWIGPAAIIIPAAMLVCIITVIVEDRRMKRQEQKAIRSGYFQRGGDL